MNLYDFVYLHEPALRQRFKAKRFDHYQLAMYLCKLREWGVQNCLNDLKGEACHGKSR